MAWVRIERNENGDGFRVWEFERINQAAPATEFSIPDGVKSMYLRIAGQRLVSEQHEGVEAPAGTEDKGKDQVLSPSVLPHATPDDDDEGGGGSPSGLFPQVKGHAPFESAPSSGLTILQQSNSNASRLCQKPLPEGWWPPDEEIARAKSDFPRVDIEWETNKFCDYWLSVGKYKKSWHRTWRVWLRNAAERAPANSPKNGPANTRKPFNIAQAKQDELMAKKKNPPWKRK